MTEKLVRTMIAFNSVKLLKRQLVFLMTIDRKAPDGIRFAKRENTVSTRVIRRTLYVIM